MTMAALFSITTAWSQNWVSLTKAEPAKPETTITRSDRKQVSFTVELSGFFSTLVTEAGVNYQRLSIPGCGTTETTGEPELPVIMQRIAIPDCSGISYSVRIAASQTLSGYRVYPVPEFQSDSAGIWHEVFTINSAAYLKNAFMPAESYVSTETGSLRDQRFTTLEIFPIQFNPVSGQLQIATAMEITLTFDNPTTDVNLPTGIFNNVATHTFLNYPDQGTKASDNDKAFEKENFTPGTIQWITVTDTAQVHYIVADYVIICAAPFFNSQCAEIQRIAEHRANYNGFDVVVLNVEDIISDNVGFFFEGQLESPINLLYKKEQRIRTCIRYLYEGTPTSLPAKRLSYVLLVGDVDMPGNTGMPSSFETGFSDGCHDYYFSCVTKDGTGYDKVGDLFIGRFCVPNNINSNDGLQKLHNMVEKTIKYETEYSFDDEWRKNIIIAIGDLHGAIECEELLDFLYDQPVEAISIFDSIGNDMNEYAQALVNAIDQGAYYLGVISHGLPASWQYITKNGYEITADYLMNNLNNTNKTSFCVTDACLVGKMHDSSPCLAEQLTHYSPDKGFVSMIASSTVNWDQVLPFKTDISYLAPQAIYENSLYITGEIFLESRIQIKQLNGNYILFGDPALNIMANGYEITQNVVAECPVEISYLIRVRNGATLTVPDSCTLNFVSSGRLIIEEDGNLDIGEHVQIYGELGNPTQMIHVKGGGFTVGDHTVFHDVHHILLENDGANSYDDNKQYDLENITFNNTRLTHSGTQLNINDCVFSERSDIITAYSKVDIQNCRFSKSGFKASDPVYTTPFPNFTPFVKIANCSFRNTGNFIIGTDDGNSPVYSTAAIMLDGVNEFQIVADTIINVDHIWTPLQGEGICLNNAGLGNVDNRLISKNDISRCKTGLYVYNSKAAFKNNLIHDNHYGVRLFNNSSTSFEGEANAANGEQIIRDNGSYELYASQNAFPIPFMYNQIIDADNGGNSSNDPLIYYDVSSGKVLPIDVSCNYWLSSSGFVPANDLYPYLLYVVGAIWNKSGPCSKSGTLYQDGVNYFAAKNYTAAKNAFMELIKDYPQSNYAIAALHELFALEQFLDNDYATLHDYYAAFTPADTALFDVADFLATRCNVLLQNWQPAIDWYENRVENPPSYPDSIFAVIDLGDIHLMMESDSLKGARVLRFPNLIPKSRKDYEENKAELLATLPKTDKPQHPLAETGKKGVLNQNIPNPANGSTTVVYDVIEQGQVELRVYNQLGQLLQSLPQGTKKEGNYRTVISLAGLPSGMYHYILFIDGEKADAKKLIVK